MLTQPSLAGNAIAGVPVKGRRFLFNGQFVRVCTCSPYPKTLIPLWSRIVRRGNYNPGIKTA